jgi:hypothetical protein
VTKLSINVEISVNIMTLDIMTLNIIIVLRIMTDRITVFSIMTPNICCYAVCHNSEYYYFFECHYVE